MTISGGHGSRGSGKVAFNHLDVICRRTDNYTQEAGSWGPYVRLSDLIQTNQDGALREEIERRLQLLTNGSTT